MSTCTVCTTGGVFWGAHPGCHCLSVPRVTKSRFAAMHCYKGETVVDGMVQTRGQQTEDQSPPGRGALRGVTAEGDTASTTVTSRNTLKHAVSAPSAEHSTAVLAGGGSGWDEPVTPLGAGSPTTVSVNDPKGASVHPLGVVSQAENGVQMTDSPQGTKGCSGIEGAVGGLASTGHHALYSVPTHRNPVNQPIIYGDRNSCYELWFSGQCAQPNRHACSSLRWDSAGWGN